MWLVELFKLIFANREANKEIARLKAEIEADGFTVEEFDNDIVADVVPAKEQVVIGENGLYYIMDTETGVQIGNAMNAFTATYTLEQLGDNNRYEIREYTF